GRTREAREGLLALRRAYGPARRSHPPGARGCRARACLERQDRAALRADRSRGGRAWPGPRGGAAALAGCRRRDARAAGRLDGRAAGSTRGIQPPALAARTHRQARCARRSAVAGDTRTLPLPARPERDRARTTARARDGV